MCCLCICIKMCVLVCVSASSVCLSSCCNPFPLCGNSLHVVCICIYPSSHHTGVSVTLCVSFFVFFSSCIQTHLFFNLNFDRPGCLSALGASRSINKQTARQLKHGFFQCIKLASFVFFFSSDRPQSSGSPSVDVLSLFPYQSINQNQVSL